MKKSKILIMICFLVLLVIFFNSSQTSELSNKISSELAIRIETAINKCDSKDNLSIPVKTMELNLVIRKFAHAFEFMILAIAFLLTLRSLKMKGIRSIFYTLVLILLIAMSDETFQLFIDGRTANVKDIFIDFMGGLIGCMECLIIKNIQNKKMKKMNNLC